MTADIQIYRYLRFKKRFVIGTRLCLALGISHADLKALDRVRGVGSMGPIYSERLSPIRYAKRNYFCADFIAFFELGGKYYCRKDQPLVRGRRVPLMKRRKSREVDGSSSKTNDRRHCGNVGVTRNFVGERAWKPQSRTLRQRHM